MGSSHSSFYNFRSSDADTSISSETGAPYHCSK
ncbi:hypothetical protein OESDEN_00564 [Oesophagostomum dentatum]|uniref:Uncharacterized protein n=1 Tax=Oesophagostomum dentatum TaxID=61180 RepID=A0A0B1TVH0_OESDE|nr:hypothetical protein OESDEN_00564 [Oesophagostomum dentatum]